MEIIQNRFQGQPEKFKKFLEILQTFRKEGQTGSGELKALPSKSKHLTEQEVYFRIGKLLENQDDLLKEFGIGDSLPGTQVDDFNQENTEPMNPVDLNKQAARNPSKRPMVELTSCRKKCKLRTASVSVFQNDLSLSEVGKFGQLNDFAFFDKVKRALKSPEVYDNFLRCISFYVDESLSKAELLQSVAPFLERNPELQNWFKNLVGLTTSFDPVLRNLDKLPEELVLDIDFSTCQRLTGSYCVLPDDYQQPQCSGRTPLCHEVLNDVWVTCPSWTEDTKFKISQSTEFVYRCEDERSELDAAIEANSSTIQSLESVMTKMYRMSPEKLSSFRLDDRLGGLSAVINQRSIRRVYGEKAEEMLENLQTTPFVTVPIVLEYLQSKDEEWRKEWKIFNEIWKEQVETYYLKSLDPMGHSFRQRDVKALRSRALLNEIQTFYVERQVYNSVHPGAPIVGPHLSLIYKNMTIVDDATNLLLHQIRRQSNIIKTDKKKICQLLKHFIVDLFHHPRMELSDDDSEEESHVKAEIKQMNVVMDANTESAQNSFVEQTNNQSDSSWHNHFRTAAERKFYGDESALIEDSVLCSSSSNSSFQDCITNSSSGNRLVVFKEDVESVKPDKIEGRVITLPHPDEDEFYNLFFANNTWYVFLRLHQILCERLTKLHDTAVKICMEEAKYNSDSDVIAGAAYRLGLKKKREVEPENYYSRFLGIVRNLLDGNMDSSDFENSVREMFTINAYISYTIDKLIVTAVRQLFLLVTDDSCRKAVELHQKAVKSDGAGGIYATMNSRIYAQKLYQKSVEKICNDQNQNCVKVIIYRKESRMTMELLHSEFDSESDTDPTETEQRAKYSTYLGSFFCSGNEVDIDAEDLRHKVGSKPVFLRRNIRHWNQDHLDTNEFKNSSSSDSEVEPINFDEEGDEFEFNRNGTFQGNLDNIDINGLNEDWVYWDSRETDFAEMNSSSVSDQSERNTNRKEARLAQLVIKENLQYRFDSKTFKMAYVAHTEDFMYLSGALKKARDRNKGVALKLFKSFYEWHKEWLRRNVTLKQIETCELWVQSSRRRVSESDSF